MRIREIIIFETVLGMPAKPNIMHPTKSANKTPVILSPEQQARAVTQNKKKKLALLVAKRQADERQKALTQVSATDKLQAFIQSNNYN